MSETPSGNPLEQTIDHTHSTDAATIAPQALGYVLYERVGVGGMGEVYRCEDDALGRDLAIKVIKSELHGIADAEERFLREARLTGSLQHPGIVPIHQLGRLADGRPYYTMKLIRGRTFADMLREEPEGPERLPRLLAVVEKVCQAVAYAHSKGVIHRDLKPANVMVGEFGEVQVMDWGLAKELSRIESVSPGEAMDEVETVARAEEAAGLSRAGAALGTPNYMPPEQAAGDWDIVDERADVFALGAILCEVLTGKPPYFGASRDEILRRARRGEGTEAVQRLQRCGADAALIDLGRECLAAERERRPRNAGGVAERFAAYQAAVRERLRQAELQRARAEVRALEECKRRRLRAGLMLAAILLLVGGGVTWWQWQRRQSEADEGVRDALKQTQRLRKEAQADPLSAAAYEKAVAAAEKAVEMSHAGGASARVRQQAAELRDELEQEAAEAAKDRRLLARLLDVRGPREGPKFRADDQGNLTALAEPTAEEQFAAAFREWGLDVTATPTSEAVGRLKARPAAVVMELIAALDEWANQRRRDGKPDAPWQPVAELAAALEDRPDSLRRELRAILARGRLPLERGLGPLAMALRPGPIPLPVPLGQDRLRLRKLAQQTKPEAVPVLGLLTLTRALRQAGEEGVAERLLRAALVARPREVVLHHTLGELLTTQTPPRWRDAVECYAAARVLRPDLGVNLAISLLRCGRDDEGLALLARLVDESPKNPFRHVQQAYFLQDKGHWNQAMAAYRQTIALDPKLALPHINLGILLAAKGRLDEGIDEFRQAIALDPKDAKPHYNLGRALTDKGQLDEAMAEYRQAIALDPKDANAHYNLGNALRNKGRLDEAITEFRQAIAYAPKSVIAHTNLGAALGIKGRLDEALAEFQQVIALDPKHVLAHTGLGYTLQEMRRWDEAMAEYRRAIALDPKSALAHYRLGDALRAKGRLDEAIIEYHQAIHFKPAYAEAHCNLGGVLRRQGRFAESLASYRRGHEFGSKQPGWNYPSTQWVRDAERRLALAMQLPAILRGEASPATLGETLLFAWMCQQPYQKRYAASARLYADAFAADPKLAADLNQQHRYNAACSAVLAAAGQGNDAHLLPDKVASMFRYWSLGWLRADLSAYATLAEQTNVAGKQAIRQRMTHWKRDPDLAAARDPQAVARLPEHERVAWHALWREVDALAKLLSK